MWNRDASYNPIVSFNWYFLQDIPLHAKADSVIWIQWAGKHNVTITRNFKQVLVMNHTSINTDATRICKSTKVKLLLNGSQYTVGIFFYLYINMHEHWSKCNLTVLIHTIQDTEWPQNKIYILLRSISDRKVMECTEAVQWRYSVRIHSWIIYQYF